MSKHDIENATLGGLAVALFLIPLHYLFQGVKRVFGR
jgi:hypothetical protein